MMSHIMSGRKCITYTFFRHGTSDGRTLHLTLGIDDNTGIILNEIFLGRMKLQLIHERTSK
jgi:hypothetical protein